MEFGEKLARLRSEKGWRQEDLAAQLYVTKQAVSKWENGRGFPDITTFSKLAEILGTTTDYLLNLTQAEQKEAAQIEVSDNKRTAEKANTENADKVFVDGVVIAERSMVGCVGNLLTQLFLTGMAIILFTVPSIWESNRTYWVMVYFTIINVVFSIVFFVTTIMCFKTPKIAITYHRNSFVYYGAKGRAMGSFLLSEIADVWAPKKTEMIGGRIRIILKDGRMIKYFCVNRPPMIKGKIDAMKNYLQK